LLDATTLASGILDGVVEVDETLVGGVKPGKRGRGADGKALVLIAVERHDGGPGRVRMRRIPNASAEILTEFVLTMSRAALRSTPTGGAATTTLAATASATTSRTSPPPGRPRTS